MTYILGLDQGTTSSRAVLISDKGKVLVSAQREFTQYFPAPGLVEHDPEEIWSSQAACIVELLDHSEIKASQIQAIGITNQRETTIVWDRKSGRPLYRAIVWQDRRTTDICQKLKKEGKESLIREKTGLLLDPYFSATKLQCILNSVPGALEQAKKGELAFGTVDSWLLWKLTEAKVHATDVTNASRTLLFNIHTLTWDDELLDLFNIPRSILPEVFPSSHSFGQATHPLLPCPIRITGIVGDQQAAMVGQTCFKPGMVKATYGTGCFMLMNTGSKPRVSKNQLLTTIAYQVDHEVAYALEGSVFIGGAVVHWLRDNLHLIASSSDIETLAASVSDSGGVFFVPAFTGLGAPYWDPYARGALVGLTRGTSAAHIARSALDSIAFQVTDLLQAMEADANSKISEIRVDGGAVKNSILMQFQADLMSVPIIKPHFTELTALGASYLAGLTIALWKNFDEIASLWQEEKRYLPSMSETQATALKSQWAKAIACTQLWED